MYLIQSNKEDLSTSDVIDWLRYLDTSGKTLECINNNTVLKSISYRICNQHGENFTLMAGQNVYNSMEIDGYWYRRGMLGFAGASQSMQGRMFSELSKKIFSNGFKEQSRLIDSVYRFLHRKVSGNMNTFRENFTNKIANLASARDAGLKVPDTIITNDISTLLQFAGQYGDMITKDIEFDNVRTDYDEEYEIEITPTVRLLTSKDIELLSEKTKSQIVAGYAMYQQYITKKYELRCFYLKGKFYTMAIFSQSNEQTKVDFRNYDHQNPNRCVPYQLPPEMETKLADFMRDIEMNCGSIDLIYTPEKEYVFLEVNPIGQFQWLSKQCNYDIERQIARQIIKQ